MTFCKPLLNAIEEEKKGASEYIKLSNRFPGAEGILIASLAKDEKKHVEILSELMDKLGC